MDYSDASYRPFKLWNCIPLTTIRRTATSMASWLIAVDKDNRAIRKLSRMTDGELTDIGLSRSDLSRDGLTTASIKRARKQDVVADEIAKRPELIGETVHGN